MWKIVQLFTSCDFITISTCVPVSQRNFVSSDVCDPPLSQNVWRESSAVGQATASHKITDVTELQTAQTTQMRLAVVSKHLHRCQSNHRSFTEVNKDKSVFTVLTHVKFESCEQW